MRKIVLILLLFLFSCTPTKVAQKSFDERDYAATISYCQNALAADSTNAALHFLLAQSYARMDSIDRALFSYERANYYQPENDSYRANYYLTVIQRGEMFLPDDAKSALSYFENAIKIDAARALAVEKKGDLYFDLEKYEQAKGDYTSALALGGDTLHIESQLAKIDSVQNIALRYLREGLAALNAKKYDKAKELFQKALDEKPDYKEAQYQLHMATGLRLYKKGSVNALWEALDSFGRASILFPDRGEPHYYTGLAYTKKDKDEYMNAIEALEEAVNVEPNGKWADDARKEAERIRARKEKMDAFFGR